MLNGDDVTALCRPGPDPDAGPGCCFNYWWPDATREHGIANLTNPVPIDETDYISDSFTRFLEGLDGRPVLHQPPVLQQPPVLYQYTSRIKGGALPTEDLLTMILAGVVACGSRFLLTCGHLMTSSHSEGRLWPS